jgi:hypothetical protein
MAAHGSACNARLAGPDGYGRSANFASPGGAASREGRAYELPDDPA